MLGKNSSEAAVRR